jgi:hypothetical protein
MKQYLNSIVFKKGFQQIFLSVAFMLTLLISGNLFAQTDSTKTDSTQKEEAAVEEESSLISPSVDFVSVQKANNTIDLKATLKAKVKGSLIKLPLLKIKFLQVTDTEEKEIGFVITDRIGKAVLNIKADSLQTNKEGKLHFKAVFAGNKSMEAAEEELTIKKARLEITPVKEDSFLTVQVCTPFIQSSKSR